MCALCDDSLEQPDQRHFPRTTTTGSSVTVGGEPTIFDLVKADLDERDRKGYADHGVALMASRNYNWLREAYEEALDLCVYLRGALVEREGKT